MTGVRAAFALLTRRQRRWGAAVFALGIVNALLEAVAASMVFTLVGIVSDPDIVEDSGVLSRVRDWSPWSSDESFLLAMAVAVAVFYALKNASLLAEVHLQLRWANRAAASVASRLLSGYLRAPYEASFHRSSSELIRNISTTTDVVYRSTILAVISLASDVFIVLGILAVLLVAEPVVTPALAVFLAVLLFAVYRLARRRLGAWGERSQELSATTLQRLQDAFGALKEIKVLGRERAFVDRFTQDRDELAKVFWRSGTAMQVPRFLIETVFIVALAVLIALVSATGSADRDRLVPIVALYAYAGFRLMPLANRVVSHLNNIRFGGAAVDLLCAESPPAAIAPAPDATPMPFRDELRLEGVAYRYPGVGEPVLRDVDLCVPRGTSLGIVGSTGAGKSTLADLVLGLLPPTSGRIAVDGRDIADDLAAWRRNIGYVAQSSWLLDDTLARNIALGIEDDIDEARLWDAIRMAQLEDVVAALPHGVDTQVGERGILLSGGQRQRIAIARALFPDPELLVLDEATSALDRRTESEVSTAIAALAGRKTLIVIAHRMSTVERCDQLVFLDGGTVAGRGTYAELLDSSDEFRRMVAGGAVAS